MTYNEEGFEFYDELRILGEGFAPKEKENSRQVKWRKELEDKPMFQNYFNQFTSASVEMFLNRIVREKNIWLKESNRLIAAKQNGELKWIERATDHLKILLQKKLFDAQCLWLAEKLELEEIQTSFDFQIWESDVFNCPFIEPVTKEDLELYTNYILQLDDESDLKISGNWQIYSPIKKAYDKKYYPTTPTELDLEAAEIEEEKQDYDVDLDADVEIEFPSWHEFYNKHRGTHDLLMPPNIRGEKESFYHDLYDKAHPEEMADYLGHNDDDDDDFDDENEEMQVAKEHIEWCSNKFLRWFVYKFENKEIQKKFELYSAYFKKESIKKLMAEDIELIITSKEKVAIEANEDWAISVQKAATKCRMKKIAEALPKAWEQYKKILEEGGYPESSQKKSMHQLREMSINAIIGGRILNGEPGDLNF